MPSRLEIELPAAERHEDRVVKAWSELGPERVVPRRIDVLKGKRSTKRIVYRLEGVGRGGKAVIAKRCMKATAYLERFIYEHVLPRLPLTAPHFYGFVEDEGELDWLFLEDVGSERFSPLVTEHRRVAAIWLAILHIGAERLGVAVSSLPDREPRYYMEVLGAARRNIERSLSSSCLDTRDRTVLESLVGRCDALASRWDRVESLCERLPRTLVHGDFRPKNVFVRAAPHGIDLYPLDWEMAGWGIPAVDLAPPRSRASSGHAIDLDIYQSVVSEAWPRVDITAVHLMENVGRLFREISAIGWASASLDCSREKSLASMKLYEPALSEAIQSVA